MPRFLEHDREQGLRFHCTAIMYQQTACCSLTSKCPYWRTEKERVNATGHSLESEYDVVDQNQLIANIGIGDAH